MKSLEYEWLDNEDKTYKSVSFEVIDKESGYDDNGIIITAYESFAEGLLGWDGKTEYLITKEQIQELLKYIEKYKIIWDIK